jgi:glycosyltransferase involved in cell wall biosynthesis/GT2 family glycosyltransferase
VSDADPVISVVIPTCRAVESLDATLHAIDAQAHLTGGVEVVVVLDGPDDARSTALRDREISARLMVIPSPGRGRAAACNAGVRAASGDVILLLDDDMVPEPGALAAHVGRHGTGANLAVVGAAPLDLHEASTVAARYIGRRFNRHLVKLAGAGAITNVSDVYMGSFSLRRSTFVAVGGFDERFTEYGHEDCELAGRLMGAGVAIEFASEAVTRQTYDKTFARLAADNVAKGRTAQQFLARHPDRAAESAVVRRRCVSRRRRIIRAMARRALTTPTGMGTAVRVTQAVACIVERSWPATADRFIDVLLDGCFWVGVASVRTSTPIAQPWTVVHYLDGTLAGGVERVALTLLTLTDRQRWRPVLIMHELAGTASTICAALDLGIQVELLPPRSGPKGLWTILRLTLSLWRLQPVVVHVHRSRAMSGRAGVVAAALARCPVVVATEHLFLPGTSRRAFRMRRVLDRAVECHVAVSESLADVLRERFRLPARAVEVVHNGVLEPERPSASAVEQLRAQWHSEYPWTLVVPARLDKNKGHATLLAAVRELPDVLVVLAGEGPERERLEHLAKSLGVAEQVRFLGHREDVPALMMAADVVVLPSNVEGLPLVLLEASALGCAIVACDVDGVAEIVQDQVSGLLTPAGAPEDLAAAIWAVLDDPEQAARLGKAARARFLARFRAERMVSEYQDLYSRLLAGGSTRCLSQRRAR